jgi:hypothetical protein
MSGARDPSLAGRCMNYCIVAAGSAMISIVTLAAVVRVNIR